jgi:putative membrane protein
MSTLNPATENDSFIYLIICGVAAVSSMLLPGLSGSFVLMLMGNYELVMIDAVNHLNFKILIPFAIGVAIGLPLFSKALSWIYRKFKNQTISILSGFILGSLSILWPWKKPIFLTDANGINIEKPDGEPVISAYQRYLPDTFDREVILCIALLLIGILTIWLIQRLAGDPQKSAEPAVNDFFSI